MQRYTGLFFDLAHNLFRNFRVSANGGPEYATTIILTCRETSDHSILEDFAALTVSLSDKSQ
jgi:hypothetical protein